MAEAFAGTWKTTGQEGDMSSFLTERGIPLPIRKVLEFMATKGEFVIEIKDGAFVETEVGLISNTVKPPVPLDGTPFDDKSPAGEEITRSGKIAGNVVTITDTMKTDATDQVINEMTLEGDVIKRKLTNAKTGTAFTVFLGKK